MTTGLKREDSLISSLSSHFKKYRPELLENSSDSQEGQNISINEGNIGIDPNKIREIENLKEQYCSYDNQNEEFENFSSPPPSGF